MRKFVMLLLLSLVSLSAMAKTMQCTEFGHTDLSADGQPMKMTKRVTSFNIEDDKVIVGADVYVMGDPSKVDLEGLAITYFQQDDDKVLYLYINEQDQEEIGISRLRHDSDDMFEDKSVFSGCSFEVPATKQMKVRDTSRAVDVRRVNNTLPVYSF
jgi:hypothetical protein